MNHIWYTNIDYCFYTQYVSIIVEIGVGYHVRQILSAQFSHRILRHSVKQVMQLDVTAVSQELISKCSSWVV